MHSSSIIIIIMNANKHLHFIKEVRCNKLLLKKTPRSVSTRNDCFFHHAQIAFAAQTVFLCETFV